MDGRERVSIQTQPPQPISGGNAGPSATESRTVAEAGPGCTVPASCTCAALSTSFFEAERHWFEAVTWHRRYRQVCRALAVCAGALTVSLLGHLWRSM